MEATHQAEMDRKRQERRYKDLQHSNSMKFIQQRINAHKRAVEAQQRMDEYNARRMKHKMEYERRQQ